MTKSINAGTKLVQVQVEEEHIPSDLEDDVHGLTEFFSVPEAVRAEVIRRFLNGHPTPEIPGARLETSDIIVPGVVTVYGNRHEIEVNLSTGEIPNLMGFVAAPQEGEEAKGFFLLEVRDVKGQVFCSPTMHRLEKTTVWKTTRRYLDKLRLQVLQSHPLRFGIVTCTGEVGENGSDLGVCTHWLDDTDWIEEDFCSSRQEAVRLAQDIYERHLVDGNVVVLDRGIDDFKPKCKIVFQLSRKA